MSKLHRSESGFGTIAILGLVIVALLGVGGYMVYQNHHKTTATTHSTTTSSKTTAPAAQAVPFVNVIQDDGSITQITPDKIAKTADETAILTALHNTCTGSFMYVTVNHIVFDGNQNFIQDGTHAEINASTCTGIAKTLGDLEGSGSATYLHKNNSGIWVRDTSSQMTPDCAKVDGLGYPTSVISSCYDGSTSRAPKQ